MRPAFMLVRGLRRLFRLGRGFSSLQFAAAGFVLIACLCVVGTELANLRNQRSKELANARSAAGNLARSLGQQAEDTARIADTSLIGPVERLEIDGTNPETLEKLRQIIMARLRAFPALASFVIADESGKCLLVEWPTMPVPCSVAGRADFEYHRTHDGKGPRLGSPIRSIGAGVWVVPLSRRFNHPDGSFAGIVTTGISIPFLQSYYDTFDIGPNGAIVLASDEAVPILLVRRPFAEKSIARDLSTAGIFNAMAVGGPVGSAE
jgi:hypothetical protein